MSRDHPADHRVVDGSGLDGDGRRSPALSGLVDLHRRSRCACRLAGHGVGGRLRGGLCDDSAAGGVAANRALLAALVATNVLGINTPAIMATEALYAEMWAQDALAMYGYAAASGAAGMLQPLSPPSQTTNPGGLAAQSAAVGSAAATAAVNQVSVADLISSLPNAVSGLASPVTSVLDSTGLSGIIADIDALLATPFVANIINSAVNTAAWYVNAPSPPRYS